MSKAVEVRGLRMVYQGRGRSVEALAALTFFTRLRGHVYAQIQQAKRDQGRAAPPSSPEGAAAAPGS
jgi:hypothetical protein